VKVSYRQAVSDDVVRQFRHYLVTMDVPEVAMRFRSAVRSTVQSLLHRPFVVRTIVRATRILQISARGRLRDLRPSGFTTLWMKTPSASFGFYTASETLSAFSNVNRPFDPA
jgi:hypothetical protein